MEQTVQEMRYAFERDMVRRLGWKAFKADGRYAIMTCEDCGENVNRVTQNQKVCPDCRVERVRGYKRNWKRRNAERLNSKRRKEP
jgi:hypothetical protein